ncbi:hypothetical protein CTAM01_07499 [Colletotrichum tamarilloi]|uniref:Uncharacterized protein n=1 Tax=Colletotrichum tamarilloi TaxID=1209934 RepID=A0ABQ9R8Y3_9PEZI|nr:uncharacterized protein CTAM01_07499 [Colletotrichum tamarilloi]KAI3550863.1 hypothetical protein CSPX01_01358 [Colletotrichum filicis]KAK1498281.1 hypothetical protein CTAM01_07499 [Colletotrichum tamarilloi]
MSLSRTITGTVPVSTDLMVSLDASGSTGSVVGILLSGAAAMSETAAKPAPGYGTRGGSRLQVGTYRPAGE